ncbi:ABC1 kinase family protein [Paenibacillus protaetiae]|uniref:AarF/ABC1/UbiB kinase family protein n=1 Tax=Paenibacillus protaetiae TaxID=2509456 RepID=A0A4P6EY65_9BACL|nr:AarF/ABC1/UbiB kinase family protein [Paenibacillus protaetiae]QAY67193.1 AarF/ABC1/UbiB kinase family protein [Paenibacillus protaetiae]
MSLGKKIRRLQRYQEITKAFIKNGFGFVAKDIGLIELLPFQRRDEDHNASQRSIGPRLRMILEELGPTFVKLGQIASTRPDFIPAPLIKELEHLQDHVAPFPYETAEVIVENELGAPIGELFREFGREPIASASIGQVYRAVLPDGTAVAVKVQRPGIERRIAVDLDILSELSRQAEARLEWARKYRLADMIGELSRALQMELDYRVEARNTERFAANAKRWTHPVHIPSVYGEYSSRKVLTMDYIEGIKLSEREQLSEAGYDYKKLSEIFAMTILEQVLFDGFFHGDPHPGNVLVLPCGELALLDFGMAGRLSEEMKMQFASFVIALRGQSTDGVIRAISKLGIIPEETDRSALRLDVDELREKYYDLPLQEISIGEAVGDLFRVSIKHDIRIPSDLTLLGKSLLTMEGVVEALDPEFSVFDAAEPFGKRLLLERLDPLRAARKWAGKLPEYADLLEEIPLRFKDVLGLIKKGKLGLEVSLQDEERFAKKLDRIGNRLSFSIVLLSFSLIMVGLIIGSSMGQQNTVLWQIPAIEIGLAIALAMFVFLIYSIFRSGRF